jgi:diguanylate cyclase (GGDEF)-like protein
MVETQYADGVLDERGLMGLTAGVLWLVGAATALAGQLMPGSPHVDPWVFGGLEVFVVGYGIACVAGWIPWTTASMRTHAVTTAALLPLIGVALWATGGSESYIRPLTLFPLLHIAYFFPVRMAAPLLAELVAVYAAPLVYQYHGTDAGFPARTLTFGVSAVVVAVVIRLLKDRLVAAEGRQRVMACTDALTGLANRRGFDVALSEALGARGEIDRGRRMIDEHPGCVLLLIDLDDFKLVNDSRGHAAGDDLLQAVAAHCAEVIRPGDTLARIGGDEFALVAPGAGHPGAERLAAALDSAIERAGGRATIAWAVHPADGTTAEPLLRAADRRLYAGKAGRRRMAPLPALPAAFPASVVEPA